MKTISVARFVTLLRESLELEHLDIQFDYFAFFCAVVFLLLDL